MNYEKHYNNIVERAKNRVLEGYVEKHHIIPRCMGGTNDQSNLVSLTAREHYVAHQLLVKMYPGNHKLVYAATMMTSGLYGRNNRVYEWLRLRVSEASKGRTVSLETREKISRSLTNKVRSEEHCLSIKNSWKNREISAEHKAKMKESGHRNGSNEDASQKQGDTISNNWKVMTPSGEVVYIRNLRKYCRENELVFQTVYKGFKGWTVEKVT